MSRAHTTLAGIDLFGSGTQQATSVGQAWSAVDVNPTYQVLHSFNLIVDGANPGAGLIQASDGNFYGTTVNGGAAGNWGTVFTMTPAGDLRVLHSFDLGDGAHPQASLIQASNGNLYGTTSEGSGIVSGTVFTMTRAGDLKVLWQFVTENVSSAGLIQGSDGNLYGTTSFTVFRMTPAGDLRVLHYFSCCGTDPFEPNALIQTSDDNFYTTSSGGAFGFGTVFTMTPAGDLTVLHSFNGSDGANPTALIQASDGNFYGTTTGGAFGPGPGYWGTVFRMTPAGAFTVLHSFNVSDGAFPHGLIQASDGNFYGTTSSGGAFDNGGNGGTVFRMTPAGALTVLHSFNPSSDGENRGGYLPFAGLIQGSDGNLYGTASAGGDFGGGVVFRITLEPKAVQLDVVDPACSTPTDCNGEFLVAAGSRYVLSQDVNQLVTARVARSGASTDGVTTLLLRARSQTAAPVTFSLLANGWPAGPALGVLLDLNGNVQGSSFTPAVQAVGSEFYAFAAYRVPIDLPGISALDQHAVTIQAASPSGSDQGVLTLRPPPLVLVHGIWSGPSTWNTMVPFLQSSGFEVCADCLVDYGTAEPAASWDPGAPGLADQFAVYQVVATTANALQAYRAKGIAASQVDVIAHSMGALVTRSRTVSSYFRPYRAQVNYGAGDFHKLITIGAPHRGSRLADFGIVNKCAVLLGVPDLPGVPVLTLETALQRLKKPMGPGFFQMQTNSEALYRLGKTDVPSHAIVGVAPPCPLPLISCSQIETELDAVLTALATNPATIASIFQMDPYDTVVQVPSQAGGLEGGAVTTVTGIVHAAFPFPPIPDPDVAENDSQQVMQRVANLLLAAIGGGEFQSLPQYLLKDLPLPDPKPCGPGGGAAVIGAVASGATVTLDPPAGTVVQPGQQVQARLTITGGNAVDAALFSVGGQLALVQGSAPFSVTFAAPADQAGQIDVFVLTFGPGPANYAAETFVIVQPTQPPRSLTASPGAVTFTQLDQQVPLQVRGSYAGGGAINVTSGSAGTTYALQSGGPSVVTVSPDGLVTAAGPGQDAIVVSNGGISTTVPVSVTITNRPPALQPVGPVSLPAGTALDVVVTASDPDGNAITLSGQLLPSFATLTDHGGGTGTIRLAPQTTDVGIYPAMVSAVDNGQPAMGTSQPLTITVTPYGTVVAAVTVATNPAGEQVSVDSATYTAPNSFVWAPGSVHTIGTASPQLSGDRRSRYLFSSWSDGGAQSHQVSPSSAATYTANFSSQYLLDASAWPQVGGTVVPNPGGPWYAADARVQLAATANTGYTFTGWSGNCAGTINPYQLTMSSAKSCTADFVNHSPALTLAQVQSWALILAPAADDVQVLSQSRAQLIVLQDLYDQTQIAAIKAARPRLVLANVDASELIDGVNPGLLNQDFVGNPIPGFPGLYSARYWLPSWLELVIQPNIQKALAAGFDGIYFDSAGGGAWAPGNPEGNPVNPTRDADMATFLITAADYTHQLDPKAIVIANGPNGFQDLVAANPAVTDHLDGADQESGWWDPGAGAPTPYSEFVAQDWKSFQATGKRLFSVDYIPRGDLSDQLKYADFALQNGWGPQLTDPFQTAAALSGHPYFAFSYEPSSTVIGQDGTGQVNLLHASGPSATVIGGNNATNYAIFGGPSSSYVSFVSGSQTTVHGEPEGTTILTNVQYLHFADGVTVPAGTPYSHPLTLAAATLPEAEVNVAYTAPVVTGGAPPYTLTFKKGHFPAGLAFSPQAGSVSGTPTATSPKSFTVRVTDQAAASVTGAFTIQIVKAVKITTTRLKTGTHGKSYSAALKAKGGAAPYAWSVASGTLPAGVTLDAPTGAITGIPTEAGAFHLTFRVTDALGGTAQSAALALTIK